MVKKALVCGVTGQDGALLARLLLAKGYEVWGTSRSLSPAMPNNLDKLGITGQVRLIAMDPDQPQQVGEALQHSEAREIYHLACQSSVGLSFDQPVDTVRGIVNGTLNLLEAARKLPWPIRFFHAGSGECFGDTGHRAATETTPFNPGSPYAVAKSAATWLTRNYRESYGLYACTGILFNHESPLRPERFVTRKIISAARRIAAGHPEPLTLGRMNIWRDWGWAEDYVEAMWRMLQHPTPEDFILATGHSTSLQDFVMAAFDFQGLDWREHVTESADLYRPSDIVHSSADPSKAQALLGWKAQRHMPDIVRMLSEAP